MHKLMCRNPFVANINPMLLWMMIQVGSSVSQGIPHAAQLTKAIARVIASVFVEGCLELVTLAGESKAPSTGLALSYAVLSFIIAPLSVTAIVIATSMFILYGLYLPTFEEGPFRTPKKSRGR